ncbi:MAG: ABC transporter permease, partial [bacterium]|nr:ABC transporter permease [bacterium]
MRDRTFKTKIILISSSIIILLIITSILAPIISPHNPYMIDLSKGCQSPSLEHPFGTDINGRDILSRTLYGMRISLLVGFLATFISMGVGLVFGVLAGYFGGMIDRLIMRIVDVTLSFPSLLLYIGISVSIGESLPTLFIALGLYGWAGF